MDEIFTSYGAAFGISIGVLSGVVAVLRDKTRKAEIEYYLRNNNELRADNDDLRDKRNEMAKEIAGCETRCVEQEKTIRLLQDLNNKQADFASIAKLISNNHKEQMKALADVAKTVARRNE